MRYRKDLLQQANFNPTRNSKPQNIEVLNEYIERKQISIPSYQRDDSWNLNKSIELFNYQLKGKAPVSAISINLINNIDPNFIVQQYTFVDRKPIYNIQRGQESVVDGQQRLTTNYKAYTNHIDFKDIVLDLGKGSFIKVDSVKKYQIPVGVLYNKDSTVYFDYVQSYDNEIKDLLLRIRSKYQQYAYTINYAADLSVKEQIKWFEVLNNAGSRVSKIQMSFSKANNQNTDIYKEYVRVFYDKLSEAGYQDFFKPQNTTVSYPVAALNAAYEVTKNNGVHSNNFAPFPSDTKEKQIGLSKKEELEGYFSATLKALDTVLDFLNDNNVVVERIDFISYLVGYVVFNGTNALLQNAVTLLKWCTNTNFTNMNNSDRRRVYTELLNV